VTSTSSGGSHVRNAVGTYTTFISTRSDNSSNSRESSPACPRSAAMRVALYLLGRRLHHKLEVDQTTLHLELRLCEQES
jgi:hypothetical protein